MGGAIGRAERDVAGAFVSPLMTSADAAEFAARPPAAVRSAGAIEIVPVRSGAERREFIGVSAAVYGGDKAFVPPLRMERDRVLTPRHNPYFERADVQLWIARQDGRAVGRISAQLNHRHLARHDAHAGHFGFIEATRSEPVFASLFNAAESWLRERGMRRCLGPFSFSINDESGLLVDGFDTPPYLMMGHAPPYYGPFLERLGYAKAKDFIAYTLDLEGRPVPASVQRLVDRAKSDPRIRLRPFTRATYERDLATMVDIFNDAWSDNWGFLPITEDEIAHMAKELRLIVHDYSACIADLEGRPVAFALALPNINEAIADLGGRLLPFGWAKLFYRLNRIKTVRVPLMGVRKELHSTPIGAVLAYGVIDGVYDAHRRHGFKTAEMSWILEDNLPMRNMIEAIGGRAYKTYRIYEKAL